MRGKTVFDDIDAIVIDLPSSGDISGSVVAAFNTVADRLRAAGSGHDVKIILVGPAKFLKKCSPPDSDWRGHDVRKVPDEHTGNSAYLLTTRAAGRDLISPPFDNFLDRYLTWPEYFHRAALGGVEPIVIFAPWAQVKFNLQAQAHP